MKKNNKMLCDVCGNPVKVVKDKTAVVDFYVCTNRLCNYGRRWDISRPENLPDWVVPTNTYNRIEA